MKTCALCAKPIEGIPYGPTEAEVCQSCWFDTGSWRAVRERLRQTTVAEAEATLPPDEFREAEKDSLYDLEAAIEDAYLAIKSAIRNSDLARLEMIVFDLEGAAGEAWSTLHRIEERIKADQQPKPQAAAPRDLILTA